MNPTKIEWTKFTWNPVSGCNHNCPYCYARKMANRLKGRFGYPVNEPFRPTLHRKRLFEPFGILHPSKIFVCSMGDLFGEWVPDDWIVQVLDVVKQCKHHTFQFLTKNPSRYSDFEFPKNAWIGYSTTGTLYHRWDSKHKNNVKFVSVEPIQEPMSGTLDSLTWIIVGAETGNRKGKILPEKTWIQDILHQACPIRIPVFVKDNAGGNVQNYPLKK